MIAGCDRRILPWPEKLVGDDSASAYKEERQVHDPCLSSLYLQTFQNWLLVLNHHRGTIQCGSDCDGWAGGYGDRFPGRKAGTGGQEGHKNDQQAQACCLEKINRYAFMIHKNLHQNLFLARTTNCKVLWKTGLAIPKTGKSRKSFVDRPVHSR